jgi:hypothetical protein
MIDANHGHGDRVAAGALLELHDLVAHIIHDASDLLDHRLVQDLALSTDFNGGDDAACDEIVFGRDWLLARNQLTKRPIAAPRLDPVRFIAGGDDTLLTRNPLD